MDRWVLLALGWVYSCSLLYAAMVGDLEYRKNMGNITTMMVSGLLGFIARKELAKD